MKKKELLHMRQLNATVKMLTVAKEDVPRRIKINAYWGPYYEVRRKYQLYVRCCVENGILKAALYYPDNLRVKGRQPSYEVYIDHSASRYITYDRANDKWLKSKLNRLESPYYTSGSPTVWMSKADSKLVSSYLGSNESGYQAILSYQKKLLEDARVRRYRKETDAWDADMALTPTLPKDWDRWVDRVGIPENYLFYEYKKQGAKTGYCTYCRKDVSLREKPLRNKTGRCPCCRREITYKSIGRLGRYLDTEEVCVYLIQKRPDGFVVREFWAGKRYRRENLKSPRMYCIERWRTIYDANLVGRIYHWGVYKQLTMRWIAGIPSGYSVFNCHGDKPGRVYGKTLPHLKATLKQTGLLEWIYGHHMIVNPDSYLRILSRVPQLEQIWKAGLSLLADECTHDPDRVYRQMKEPQSTALTKALGLDRPLLNRLRQKNGGIDFLRWLQFEKQNQAHISDEVLSWFCEQQIRKADLDFILDRMSAVQIYNYLRRQAEDSQEGVRQVLTTWRDYLSMAERLGIDTNDEIIYQVKLLRQRHDELVLRCHQADMESQACKILEKFPNVDLICQELKGKYEYANQDYAIVAPNGVLDIILEGDKLCHCLRGSDRYWDRIENHESFILFLRRISAMDVPYYTLEVEPDGTVRQKRTKFDRQEDDIDDAKKFLTEWQRVLTKRLTSSDRKKAEKSRTLRELEFEQMRRENVIIYTGSLAGQKLVDVLTADLMEAAA